jgi:hypothetical protein
LGESTLDEGSTHMKLILRELKISETHQAAIPVEANLRTQVKPRSGGRSQNVSMSDMNKLLNESSVSVEANLRTQVKPRSGGRSQNRRLMKGLPI